MVCRQQGYSTEGWGLFVCLTVCSTSICLSVCLFDCLQYIYLSVCLFVCLHSIFWLHASVCSHHACLFPKCELVSLTFFIWNTALKTFLIWNTALKTSVFIAGAVALRSASFGQGADPIFLDNMACVGTETFLRNCPNSGIGLHNCRHAEDASVVCTGEESVVGGGGRAREDRREKRKGRNKEIEGRGKVTYRPLQCHFFA